MSGREREAGSGVVLPEDVHQLAHQYQEVCEQLLRADRQSADLAKLYVALRRLYESPDREGAIAGIAEIVVSMIGSEQFALFELDGDATALALMHAMGVDARAYRRIPLDAHPIGRLVRSGARARGPVEEAPNGPDTELDPLVCTPLMMGEALAGAVVIFGLLAHKSGLEPVDLELLDLLGAHAIPAVRLAELRERTNLAGGGPPRVVPTTQPRP